MGASQISAWSSIVALLLTFASVTFAGIQLLRFRKDLKHQTDMALYSYIFEWDRFLLEHPAMSELLLKPSSDSALTLMERRLAEYRLDLAEFAFRKSETDLYDAEPDFFARLVEIPLIRKAILSGDLKQSLRPDFLARCETAAEMKIT